MSDPSEAPSSPLNEASPEPEEKSPLPRLIIVEDGDLQLRVGAEVDGREQEFLVCSVTMQRATPAWKAMLFGGFKESKPAEGEWIVSLPADKAAPLFVFMNIIHSQFKYVPKRVGLSDLYDILVMADKYGLSGLIQPWAYEWSKTLAGEEGTTGASKVVMLTHASWALDDIVLYDKMKVKLILSCSINDDDELILDGKRLHEYPCIGPPDLLDMVEGERKDRIREILSAFHKLTDELLEKKVRHSRCSSSEDCVYNALGRIWVSSTKNRGSFIPKRTEFVTESLGDLCASVLGILSHTEDSKRNGRYCDHTSESRKVIERAVSPADICKLFGTKDPWYRDMKRRGY